MMKIYIPTYRRTGKQIAFRFLSDSMKGRAAFVCDEYDAPAMRRYGIETIVVPLDIRTIAQKRAWLLVTTQFDKIVMIDDDVNFSKRRPDNRLTKATPEEVEEGLLELEAKLDDYVHAGFHSRQGANVTPPGWIENKRMMYLLGYRPAVLREKCVLGRIEHREDFDYALQLLRQGYKNTVSTNYLVDQGYKYGAPGGASEQRKIAESDADALLLQKLHPGFVVAEARDYISENQKNTAANKNRVEVRISWEKAWRSSQ